MVRVYTSKYGKIVKQCPGLHEFWHKGKLIAKGSSISSPNPDSKPTPEDWMYCTSLIKQQSWQRLKKVPQAASVAGAIRQMENLLALRSGRDGIMKCKCCGNEIVRIKTCNGTVVCNADPVTYWIKGNPNTEILTPNGERVYCRLDGKLNDACGIGYTHHTCYQ